MAHLYYVDELTAEAQAGDHVALPPGESRHAAKVSRTRRGEEILVSNARGVIARAEVLDTEPVVVELADVTLEEPPARRIGLVQALATGGRDELGIQAATEVGADAIFAWQADRSVSVWRGEKRARSLDRWRTIVREAGKQSLRSRIPEVHSLVDSPGLAGLGENWRLVVLDPQASHRLAEVRDDGRDILLVVGPEGGFSEREHALFTAVGAESARLGRTVVRSSTAGVAGLVVLNTAMARLGW